MAKVQEKIKQLFVKPRVKGFTIIELMVVIAIIGILALIGIVSYNNMQAKARDSQRETKISAIFEELEKYYNENGEYPSCTKMSRSVEEITTKTLPNLDSEALSSPRSNQGVNSLLPLCEALNETSNDDYFAYIGDVNDPECLNGDACLRFTLQYRKESTGEIISVHSKHAKASTPASKPVVLITLNSGNILATITPVECLYGTAQYTLKNRTDDNAWTSYSTWSQSQLTHTQTSSIGTKYSYVAKARCFVSSADISSESVGDEATYNTIETAPLENPVIKVTAETTSVKTTVTNSITCGTGATAQYSFKYKVNSGTYSSYSDWINTNYVYLSNATQGAKYTYTAQARCYKTVNGITSTATTSAEVAFNFPINTPAAPTVTASTSGATTTYSWTAITCPASTTVSYQYRNITTTTSSWYSTTSTSSSTTTSSEGYTYTKQVQARCYSPNITSAWSASGSASYFRPIQAPTFTSYSITRQSAAVVLIQANATCSGGTQIESRLDLNNYAPRTWLNGGTGWYGDTNGGVWMGNDFDFRGGLTVTDGSGTLPSGIPYNIKAQFRCSNSTTGLYSAVIGDYVSGVLYSP